MKFAVNDIVVPEKIRDNADGPSWLAPEEGDEIRTNHC